ncbi:MAG: 5'/3'-nucleotidase SurE [Crocinitomicaceae bacterium TMED16]|nr:MAG: 5'/3'-nucleotidase SurE [Crocinitomicaceae bacterium TMED16]|tara:strand:+ start:2514 stop:3287 length:774 start_codon:yes stop_codon:yes gene_type:complete
MNKLILVTNDDSVHAKGIRELVAVASEFGDVLVVAPNKPQSGMGHAITITKPLRLEPYGGFEKIEAYSCSGTPVDCVKLGVFEVLKRKPDLLLSGINHGENSSTNVLYSGTMSAAIEGAMEGIPSIGFSLADFDSDADFSATKEVAKELIPKVLKNGLPKNTSLNVNVPKVSYKDLKGLRVCTQAHAYWEDKFDSRKDQFGRPYYWLTGEFSDKDQRVDTDLYYLKKGFATIVPTHFDLTHYSVLKDLKYLDNEGEF